jgi:YD repeat-containing protein
MRMRRSLQSAGVRTMSGFAAFLFASALGAALHRQTRALSQDAWHPQQPQMAIANVLEPDAGAAPACGIDPTYGQIAEQDIVWFPSYEPNSFWMCGPTTVTDGYMVVPYTFTTYCSGQVTITQRDVGICHATAACDEHPDWLWRRNDNSQNCTQGNCACSGPQGPTAPTRNCFSACPQPKPCCRSGNCDNCSGDPVSLVNAELAYEMPVFSLRGIGGGFPESFSVLWFGRMFNVESAPGGVLGARATHSFNLYLDKALDPQDSTWKARVSREDGSVEPFAWNETTSVWEPENGELATLEAAAPTICSSSPATMTLPSGEVYTFNDNCDDGTFGSGQIRRVDRPNGDFEAFELGTNGLIARATNRFGDVVQFHYETQSGGFVALNTLLSSVTSPSGDVFALSMVNPGGPADGFLHEIDGPDGAPLWTLTMTDPVGGLERVEDARGNVKHSWTYVPNTLTLVPLSESGPDAGSLMTYGNSGSTTTIQFTAADSSLVTNSYSFQAEIGGAPQVTSRTLAGACPNCGTADTTKVFWPGKNQLRSRQDANGFFTVFEDLRSQYGNYDAAYDAQGNSLVVYSGCTDTTTCAGGHRVSQKYVSGTSVVAQVTRSSVHGSDEMTEGRSFEPGSTRLVLDTKMGWTASNLSTGAIDTLQMRTTSYSYSTIGTAGRMVTEVDGPYLDDGSHAVPSDAPKTVYSYYASNTSQDADACLGVPLAKNLNRIRSAIRTVASGRALETDFCLYDGAGHPTELRNPDGSITILAYDSRGSVTSSTVDNGGLGLTTSYSYDANGNLTVIKLPSQDSGFELAYDAADRVTDLQQGSFSGQSFTPLQSMHVTYDAWGNRKASEYKDSSGTTVVSSGATYDAFNRLLTLVSPSVDGVNGPTRRTFDYDSEGHLRNVTDSQSDFVLYGSGGDPTKYDRFGKISLVEQEICQHPASDPDAPCAAPTPTPDEITYSYDAAEQLQQVQIADHARDATIVTEYTTDDFGQLVRLDSPDSGTSTYLYDGAGRLVSSRDARGKTFQFQYDRLGRVTRKVNASPIVVVVTQPANGTAVVNGDNTITYTPNPGFTGQDSYSYTVQGRNGDNSTATVTVTVQ